MSEPLSARSARTLVNVADALADPAGLRFDPSPQVSRRLRWEGVGAARRCWLALACIEWQPLLTLRSRRGFSHLDRERRRAQLDGWRRSRLGLRRRVLADLEGRLAAARRDREAEPGAGP